MTLQQRLKQDLAAAIKAQDEARKSTLRVAIGELGRGEQKEISDDQVIKILQKLIKSEKEVLEKKGAEHSEFIDIIEAYLPKMAADEEIAAWIQTHIDFSQYKNKMQAMSAIMKHFGSAADGNRVKAILQKM